MATTLRQVLSLFEHRDTPLSLTQAARELSLEPGMLEGMIEFWVRKGKLKETSGAGQPCTSCGTKGACPFVTPIPRTYQLAGSEASDPLSVPCSAGSCGCSHAN
jgi:hypothetical protein